MKKFNQTLCRSPIYFTEFISTLIEPPATTTAVGYSLFHSLIDALPKPNLFSVTTEMLIKRNQLLAVFEQLRSVFGIELNSG